MLRRVLLGAFAAVASMVLLASPVLAHGDHDAQPLARHLVAGPFIISLWQIYSDAGVTMAPHVIVMFDEGAPTSQQTVTVTVNSRPTEARPSLTTTNGWDTTEGVVEQDVVAVTISDGSQAWAFGPVVVPPPPTSSLPMREIVIASILVTLRTAWWVAGRTARAWRKPVANPV